MIGIIEKLAKPLETIHGWICTLAVFGLSFLGDGANLVVAALAVTVLDAVFGVWSSVKRGRFFESRRLRDTVVKLLIYFALQIATLILDKVMGIDLICVRVTTALIVVCEIWSMLASVTIIYPDFVVGKLLKKYLSGEIANKLALDKDDVSDILENKKKDDLADSEEIQ